MKRIILFTGIFLLTVNLIGQTGTGWAQQRAKMNFKDSTNFVKATTFDNTIIMNGATTGATTLRPFVNASGTLIYPSSASIDTLSTKAYARSVGGGAAIDTTSLSNRIDLKANIASPTFTGTVTLPTATSIGDVSSTEIEYVNNVTSNIQTQLNARGRVATITTNILAGEETDVTLTGVTAEPYSLYIIDADGLNITDAVKDSTAISGGVYHTYIYSVDAKTNAKIRVLW